MDKRNLPSDIIEFIKATSTGASAADETLSPPDMQHKRIRRRTLTPLIGGGFALLLIGVTGIFARWYVNTVATLLDTAEHTAMRREVTYQQMPITTQPMDDPEATEHESLVAKLRQQTADAEKEARRTREAYDQLEQLVLKATSSSRGSNSKDLSSAFSNLALMLKERDKTQNKPVWPPPAFLLIGKVVRKAIDPEVTLDVLVWLRRSNDGPYQFTGYCFLLDYEKHPVVRAIKGEMNQGNKLSFDVSNEDELLWPQLTKKVEPTVTTRLRTRVTININALMFKGTFGPSEIEGAIII